MTPHKQLISHDPANGAWGDCWRTCMACLLDMNPSEIPNFVEGGDQLLAAKRARAWLKERGFHMIVVCMLEEHAGAAAEWFGDALYILTGKSPNIPNIAHCVVGRGPFEVVWDPARSGAGLAGPWVEDDGRRVYVIEFIVPDKLAAYREAA